MGRTACTEPQCLYKGALLLPDLKPPVQYPHKILTSLTFICPCIASTSPKYNQQDATFSRSIYFYKLLYMFQAVSPPIIRSTKLYLIYLFL